MVFNSKCLLKSLKYNYEFYVPLLMDGMKRSMEPRLMYSSGRLAAFSNNRVLCLGMVCAWYILPSAIECAQFDGGLARSLEFLNFQELGLL